MAGLDPAIHVLLRGAVKAWIRGSSPRMTTWGEHVKGGWVYIMTDKPSGTLYVGVTSNIAQRAYQHREGLVEGFTKRYGLKRLVYAEAHDEIGAAIQREKNIKHWRCEWKVKLIHSINPDWDDLYGTFA
jgi:putative endonuclease